METETRVSDSAARVRWLLVVGLLVANMVLLAMGSLAAAFGGALSSWGNGAGGLDGWADLSQTIFSLVVGVAAGIATFREGRAIPVAVAVFATGLLIGSGYLIGGHLVDPCDRGWWDARSRIGDQPLCEGFGRELSVHTRFHLLLHATLGVLSAAAAVLLYRRTRLIGGWPPERVGIDFDGFGPRGPARLAGHTRSLHTRWPWAARGCVK